MNETNNPPEEKPPVRHTVLKVPTLKMPDLPTDIGNEKFYKIDYVTEMGKLVKHPCTKEVWQNVQGNKLYREVRSDFILSVRHDDDGDIIVSVSVRPKPNAMPGFNQDGADARHLVVEMPDNSNPIAINIPERSSPQHVDDALRALESAKDLAHGSVVGRYKVSKLVAEDGRRMVTLIPTT